MLDLQRLGWLSLCGMQSPNALERLAHDGCLGRIWKALFDMPLRNGGKTLLESGDGQGGGVIGEVTGDAVSRRRQKPAPFLLEMANRRSVAAARIFASRCVNVYFK
ncbi:hypothetical protein [Chromobacterium violaceum]|uniref:hypothetical protein n=1 Tax=Chromobacterium violaceum TaxID=536 RepID=UPI001CC7ABBF|nr:hypothetical protein [Chromobacterium violaceum]